MIREETSGDTLCISTLFEAISCKDEHMLEGFLREATIETVLRFESIYGFSPLLWCVQTCDESYLGVVRRLLSSGLYDSQMVDSKGRPMLASIADKHTAKPSFVESMIKLEIDGVDEQTACYRILKQNSLPLFKLYQRDRDETKLFEALANALIQLGVKKFALAPELKLFVQWKLADYSYRNLSGDYRPLSTQAPPSGEWKKHIAMISDCWNVIAEKYDNENYADIDDCLLQRLTVIHNHLYFLQYKKFVMHLPMQEIIFSLAMFLFVFNVDSVAYRLIVNKRLIMQFLRMIVLQLNGIKESLLKIENQLKDIIKKNYQLLENNEKDALINDLLNKIDELEIPNKAHFINKCNEKKESLAMKTEVKEDSREKTTISDKTYDKMINVAFEKGTLIRDLLKTVKKHDEAWAEPKNQKFIQLESESRDRLIKSMKDQISHIVHPANVANQLIALLKSNKPLADVVVDIVATEAFSMERLMDRQHQRTARQLIKCYSKLKQYYSLNKIYGSFSQVAQLDHGNADVFVPCIKRALTVLGETMKNTKSTPNMPDGRIRNTLEQLLTSQLSEFNISHRNTYAKAFSLKRLLIADSLEEKILINLPHYMTVVRVMLLLLLTLAGADIRRSFYGMLHRCKTLNALRSLLVYAGKDDDLVSMQKKCLAAVQKYFEDVDQLLMELKKAPVGRTAQFVHVEQQLAQQRALAEEMRTMLETEEKISLSSMYKTCFACDNMITIRRLLRWKLVSYYPNRLLDKMASMWDTSIPEIHSIVWFDPRIVTINTATVPNKLKAIQVAMNTAHYYDCIEQTRKFAKEIGILDSVDAAKLHDLNHMLRPYYDKIFFLDNKWKTLKAFCKQNRLPWDKALEDRLRESDQVRLQKMFDDRRSTLRSILEKCNIKQAEDIQMEHVSPCTLSALEFIQLEMCEMLTGVGYFGDNFHYLKHRIPIIMGKSYRNMLAHDTLSYDILTDSGENKIVMNAFILASTKRVLFDKPCSVLQQELNFPSPKDTFGWVEKQEQLLEALKKKDLKLLHETMQKDGEIKSLFCLSPDTLHHRPSNLDVTKLAHHFCHSSSAVIQLINRYYPSFAEYFFNPELMLQNALDRIMFVWPRLLSECSSNCMAALPMQGKQDWLKLFLDYGNVPCAREMVSTYMVEADPHTISHAMMRGMYSITTLLVQRATRLQTNDLKLAIIMHWNDLLNTIAVKTVLDNNGYITLLQTAVKVNNSEALAYLLQDNRRTEDSLKKCIIQAAAHGRNNILQYLLNNFHALAPSTLLDALREAAATKHFKTVRLLLEEVSLADERSLSGGHNVIRNILLGLTMFGQARLIRKMGPICNFNHHNFSHHPLALAVQHRTATPKMFAALRMLGFGWLDCTSILHKVIQQGIDQPYWNAIWNEIDEQLSTTYTLDSEHWTTAFNVLQRWNMIAFVEQVQLSQTSLYHAIQLDDDQVLRALLKRSRDMRVLQGTGVLRDIVFQNGSEIIQLSTKHDQWNVRTCCNEITNRIKNLQSSSTNGIGWQEFTIVCDVVDIQFAVFAAEEIAQPVHEAFMIKDTTALINNLQDIKILANLLFSKHTIWHATYAKDNRNVHFWRFEDMFCTFDVYSPGSTVNLSLTVNVPALAGRTALHSAVLKGADRKTLKLLIENGANPVQKDKAGYTPIHFAFQNPTDPETALYLMEECRSKDVSILDITDGGGQNRLIHTAVMRGHKDAIEYLLKNNADVTVRNVFLQTPAHILAIKPVYGSVSIMKQLLDRDRSVLQMVDEGKCTPLCCAAKVGCIDLLNTIMNYGPDFNIPENRAAICNALMQKHVQWAIRFVQHLTEKGIRGITKLCDKDVIILSLECNDWELLVLLMEYELEHKLTKKPTEDVLFRFVTIIEGAGELKNKPESERFIKLLKFLVAVWMS